MSSLSQKIAVALDSSASPPPPPCLVSVEDGPRRLSLDLAASGPVGLAFDTLRFAPVAPESWTPAGLKGWADTLAAKITYLMEPLAIHEHDQLAGALVLRSQSPTPRREEHAFFEIKLDREGTLTLGRIAFDDDTRRRRPVPCQMTREVLERLVDDLVASIR